MPTVDRRARQGIETDPERMDQTDWVAFLNNVRELRHINAEDDPTRARDRLMHHLHGYTGLERLGGMTPEEVDNNYEHYRSCVSAAQKEIMHYLHEMVVGDIAQRLSLVDELTGVNDPLILTDILLTTRDQITRFEVRRALHAGAMYYEYDQRIGREAELHSIIHGVEIYLAAHMFTTGHSRDVELFHKVQEFEGSEQLEPSSIRIPEFDDTTRRRARGENKVRLTFREFPDPAAPEDLSRIIHVIMERRLKDRFSAMLKAIRKGVSIGSLKDVIGMAMYVDHHDSELHTVVNALERLFDIDPKDRRVHPLRRTLDHMSGSSGDTALPNRYSSDKFKLERLNIKLHPQLLLQNREMIDQVLGRFFSSLRSIEAFWGNIEKLGQRPVPMEIQVGTLADMLRYNLAGGDENHRVYKAHQAGSGVQGDGRVALELLAPNRLYGIDWNSPEIQAVLKAKQLAQLGLNRRVLESLAE